MPKKSPKSAPRKTASPSKRAPKAPSPMQKIEHSVGPQTDGQAEQARAAHALPPEVPRRTPARTSRSVPPPMNTLPSSSPAASAVDEGEKR